MTEEILDFTVDKAILHSIILSQAGTLAKAILEAAMNSIDAGATSLTVSLSADTFVLYDDGRGFQSRDEIEKWFRKFGTPHEDGDSTYGRYRMGRGQMMAFAVNVWRTGTFQMSVDIKNKGMGFGLKEGMYSAKGCRITGHLYEPLSGSELNEVIRDFSNLVKFAQIPVRLNGKVVSKNPKDITWDLVTDDAYIKIDREKDKPLQVYNLGVLVKEYSNWTYGCGGVVVSKKPLMVNFARNDILLSSCEVWKRISKFVKTTNVQKVANKGSLSDGERSFLANQYTYGEIKSVDFNPMDLKLITDVTGRHHSIRDLQAATRVSVTTEVKGRIGSQLHRQGAAFMVSQETLSRFNARDVADMLSILATVTGEVFPQAVSFAEVAKDFSEKFSVIPEDALPAEEMLAFKVLLDFHDSFYSWYLTREKSRGIRELHVGDSNVFNAWTDGCTYITIERKLLKRAVKRGALGFIDLLTTLTHEYVHEDADLESHDHDVYFYNKFHDIFSHGGASGLMTLALRMEKALNKALGKAGLLPDKGEAAAQRPSARLMTKKQISAHELSIRQFKLPL